MRIMTLTVPCPTLPALTACLSAVGSMPKRKQVRCSDGSLSERLLFRQRQRKTKTKGIRIIRKAVLEDAREYALACKGPDDCPESPWLHLAVTKGRSKTVGQLEDKGCGLVRALSQPFFQGDSLVQEVKWVGANDSVFDVLSFDYVLSLFGMDVPFLEWITWRFYHGMHAFSEEMHAMEKQVQRIPVCCCCFLLQSCPLAMTGSDLRRGTPWRCVPRDTSMSPANRTGNPFSVCCRCLTVSFSSRKSRGGRACRRATARANCCGGTNHLTRG